MESDPKFWKIREWRDKKCPSMPDEILHAGEWLESKGMNFIEMFGTADAVDRAAWLLCEFFEKNDDEGEGKKFFGKYWSK